MSSYRTKRPLRSCRRCRVRWPQHLSGLCRRCERERLATVMRIETPPAVPVVPAPPAADSPLGRVVVIGGQAFEVVWDGRRS